jgi:hypothetical protein
MRRQVMAGLMLAAGLAIANSPSLAAEEPVAPVAQSWTSAPVPQDDPCAQDDSPWQCLARFRPPLAPLEDGRVIIRYTVEKDGRVRICAHDRPADQAILGVRACAYMVHARFDPEKSAGRQQMSIFDWTLPEALPLDAEVRPAVPALILTEGYRRTYPDGQTDPCDTLACESGYPVGARRRRSEGVATYHAVVTREGRATLCWVSVATIDADLDLATCNLILSRARFKPAQDKTGAPCMAIYTGNMRWVLEE